MTIKEFDALPAFAKSKQLRLAEKNRMNIRRTDNILKQRT